MHLRQPRLFILSLLNVKQHECHTPHRDAAPLSRAELFFACLEDFERLYNESKKIMLVKVTSATELTEDEKSRLAAALKKKYALEVELQCVIDKSILGGIIVETGDSVLDGSLTRKLRDVKEVIKA